MKRKMNIKLIKSLVAGSLLSFPAVAFSQEKPNILFILADDLGSGDLSCQGGIDIQTPNIDRLFKAGVRFSSFYSNSTVSSPTRSSLITGCYPDMVGVPGVIRTHENDNWGYLKPDVVTLPQMLKKGGYKTALIGKWHLGLDSPNLPNEKGFDFFHGFLGDMMDDYWNHRRHGINYMRLNGTEVDPKGHASDIFTEWADSYIREEAKNTSPFFLYLAYNAPHFPIQPPEEWLEKVRKREGNIGEKRLKNIALVEHLDFCIGNVIKALQETGQYNNTIIIFTSDNGGHLPSGASNGTLRGGKQDMYEGGIKVPACMVWQKSFNPGTVSNKIGCTMDFYPTLCSVAGVKPEHPIDGIDMMPGLTAESKADNERTIFFVRREGGEYGGLCYYAARKGDFKLLQNTPFESLQLFNLALDPREEHPLDIIAKEFQELKSAMAQHIRKSGSIPWQKLGEN